MGDIWKRKRFEEPENTKFRTTKTEEEPNKYGMQKTTLDQFRAIKIHVK